jgi:hypothetical protein
LNTINGLFPFEYGAEYTPYDLASDGTAYGPNHALGHGLNKTLTLSTFAFPGSAAQSDPVEESASRFFRRLLSFFSFLSLLSPLL